MYAYMHDIALSFKFMKMLAKSKSKKSGIQHLNTTRQPSDLHKLLSLALDLLNQRTGRLRKGSQVNKLISVQ
jgi:hypothetical protein